MKFISAITLPAVLLSILLLSNLSGNSQSAAPAKDSSPIFGFRNPAGQRALESRFIAVPDPKLAEEHLRILTQAPAHGWNRRGQGDRRLRGPKIPRGRP